MNRGKDVYDRIKIPSRLSERVNEAISSVSREEADRKAKIHGRNRKIIAFVKSTGLLAASFLICLTAGVNSSQVLAKEIGNLPLIGPFAQVLTIRSYEEQAGDINLQAQVPGIQIASAGGMGEENGIPEETEEVSKESCMEMKEESACADEGISPADENQYSPVTTADGGGLARQNDYAADVNAEIDKIVEEFIARAKTDMEEYKAAFFETGGTEEEWADRTMDVNVYYEVKYQEGARLSMLLYAGECYTHSYQEIYYYNLDLEKQKDITLEEMLGPDYINLCNESILAQIEKRIGEDENVTYFGFGPHADELEEEMKFTTITPQTHFYINENGNVVICFEKYEIAPGYMGVCEFEIVK